MPEIGEPHETEQRLNPQRIASLQLTEQARILIQESKPDEAIRTLERAVNLHPTNGSNYYYLAEAWIMKGNFHQAREFNTLAVIYLRSRGEWKNRIQEQQERISRRPLQQ